MNQFAKDLNNFAVQFVNTQLNTNFVPKNSGAAPPLFRQDVNKIRPTTFKQIIPGSINKPQPGITTQTTLRSIRQITPQLTTSTPKITPVRIKTIPVSTPTTKREENKNSKGVERTTKKNTKITFTFNGVSN